MGSAYPRAHRALASASPHPALAAPVAADAAPSRRAALALAWPESRAVGGRLECLVVRSLRAIVVQALAQRCRSSRGTVESSGNYDGLVVLLEVAFLGGEERS